MEDPYEAPLAIDTLKISRGPVSEAVDRPLAATKAWARFLAIMSFIICGFTVLRGIGMIVAWTSIGDPVGMDILGIIGRFGFEIGLIYIVLAFLYFYPALKLNQYATRIGSLLYHPTEENLVSTLDAQRSLWKFFGIIALLTLSFWILSFIWLIGMGAAGAV